ncbi:membrane protein [Siccirubricoccus deserti]|uniref:DUF2244 domain-containing protein n=1 Tax=Siccirubricoccus deserti TaxID=2013562 RepID=A0A9X0UFJ7_9PROT|nr:DUF2244 domain-containing protein [Siccirubricoccus deserti]MBC4014455.1 DUF2244 domain-containing protein [Siccirubricoccus deserti]GGC32733.1 membrane protein [Siccirubricoccus deserti]
MSSRTGPVLFEAICTPARSLGRRGMVMLSVALLGGAAATGGLFLALGAWPVLGFAGIEAGLVLFLVSLHRRWSQRSMEVLLLTEGSLTIRRTDARGRQREFSLDPYWARLRLEERPGRVSLLVLERRGEAIEVGQLLGEAQKRDLAAALGAALRRWREPAFDNPQLREDG